MLRREELTIAARLVRIGLTEEEQELFSSQLSKIVNHFTNLRSLDLTNIEPTSHIVKISCPRRLDKKIVCAEDVLAKMAWMKAGLFFVPIITDALAR